MIEVAGDIAQGDLDRRVPEMKEGTELGALAHSLNTMIASMQSSIHEREESEMTMRRFLGDASHELRTPLTVIRGYAELLGNEQVLNEAQRTRAIQRLDTESTRMETLVLDLLNLARLDEHRPLSIKPVDIAQLTRDALDDLRLQQPSREITVTAPSSAIVRGDETRLRQVMANLVGNIRSYTPDDSAVNATITIADNQKWHDASVDVVLTLDDSGPGIPADQYELARQRFGRLDVSRARSTGGFGLGLSIVDAVVQAHDGDFSLSESPTRGLRVTVRLPIDGPDVVEDDTDVLRPDAKPSDSRVDTRHTPAAAPLATVMTDNVGA
jgi:two-component system OmpR family sensor kinase